jgi:hypothetical protein
MDSKSFEDNSMSNVITDLLTGGVGSVVESVVKSAGELFTSDSERLNAENESKRIDADIEKAYLADTDSARKMQIAALQQEDVFAKRFVYYFSIGWSVFAAAFMAVVTLIDIPKENMNSVNIILGFLLGTAVSSIFSFFLGTTKNSQQNAAALRQIATK